MTLPPAWLLSCYGIAITLLFGAWKLVVTPRLERRAAPSGTLSGSLRGHPNLE